MFSLPLSDRQLPRYQSLLFFFLLFPKLIRLFPRLLAGSCSCRLDPQRQRNAGGYSDGRLKMNTIHTHACARKKTEIGFGIAEEKNGVIIMARRNEVGDECIDAPYHPWRGTQVANATAPAGQSSLRPA